MPALPRAAIFRPMLKRSLLALPAIAGVALLATRLVPGSLPDGSTLLPSGWRIRPAGRVVPIGTLPLNLVTLSDGSVIVSNDGYGENSLMRIDPVRAQVVWHVTLPVAWLGLARTGRDWRDTVWASGGATNRVYRFAWQGGASWIRDSVALADSGAKLYTAGLVLLPRQGLVAVVGNLSDSVYFIDAATLERRGVVAVGHRPYTAVANGSTLYVSNWGDSPLRHRPGRQSARLPVHRLRRAPSLRPGSARLGAARRARGGERGGERRSRDGPGARAAHGRARAGRTSGERSQRARPVFRRAHTVRRHGGEQ